MNTLYGITIQSFFFPPNKVHMFPIILTIFIHTGTYLKIYSAKAFYDVENNQLILINNCNNAISRLNWHFVFWCLLMHCYNYMKNSTLEEMFQQLRCRNLTECTKFSCDWDRQNKSQRIMLIEYLLEVPLRIVQVHMTYTTSQMKQN